MSEVPLLNTPEARTETGEIKDQAAQPSSGSTTPETKTELPKTETTTEPEPKSAEPKAPEGAPEKYTFTAPEGHELNAKLTEEASGVFKELNLTQAQADRIIALHNKQVAEGSEASLRRMEELRTEWRGKVLADPALGNGTELRTEVKAAIGRAIDSMGPKLAADFREQMALTGAGDNPAVIHGLLALAKRATEGTAVRGAGPSPGGQGDAGRPASAAKALYPNLA